MFSTSVLTRVISMSEKNRKECKYLNMKKTLSKAGSSCLDAAGN